ncbi:MAG: CHAT domain-containing protein [Acidobacteria bacterium]|nr:CHAT domain-containing protein [Acidobacteriota bacterium]
MSGLVVALAEEIKERGRQSPAELPPLLQKAEQLAQDEHQDVLTRGLAHRAAGNALQLLNKFEPALAHYNEAISLLEGTDEETELARTLIAKVGPLSYLSRFDELLPCASRARALLEKLGDRKRLGHLDINLAFTYIRLDRHVESLECSERALAALEAVSDKDGILAATMNSAVTLSSMHEFERAERYFEKALQLSNELGQPVHTLVSRYNLAYLRYLGGDPGEALREFAEVRKVCKETHEERRLCLCWIDESEILLEIGDLEESIQAARNARALALKLGLNIEAGKSFLFEAAAGLRLGRTDEALDLLEKATKRFEAEGNSVLAAASKLQAALFRGERGEASALSVAAAVRSHLRNSGLPHRLALADIVIGRIQRCFGDLACAVDSFKSALEIAEKSRSKWMQFHACYELGLSLAAKKDPGSASLFRRAEQMLDFLWDRLGSDDLKMAFLTDRENVYTHLVRSELRESPNAAFGFSEKARSRVLRERLTQGEMKDSLAIQSRLSADETFVEYFITGDDLCIFTVNSGGLKCVHRPGVVGRIKQDWENLDRHFASCSVKWERLKGVQRQLESTARSHLQSLYQELLAPVRSEFKHSVVFSPHGFLHGVPLHALHDGDRFMAEAHQIAYSPSASLYCSAPREAMSGAPLLVGFSAGREVTSDDEVRQAAEHLQGASVLINPSIDELRQAFDEPRSLIHIAGHAGIDVAGGRISWIETPAGRLTGRDLMDMQIRAKTLVITGCQTARRVIRPGDEWLGLMRAFYMSGASAIVSVFWDIRDEAARRFSSEFYEYFDGGNAPSAARKAMDTLRNWQAHPYFWAGFGVFARKDN